MNYMDILHLTALVFAGFCLIVVAVTIGIAGGMFLYELIKKRYGSN